MGGWKLFRSGPRGTNEILGTAALQVHAWLGKDGENREQRAQGEGLPGSYFSPAGRLLQVRRNAPVLANSVVASNQMAQEFSMSFFYSVNLSFFPLHNSFYNSIYQGKTPVSPSLLGNRLSPGTAGWLVQGVRQLSN